MVKFGLQYLFKRTYTLTPKKEKEKKQYNFSADYTLKNSQNVQKDVCDILFELSRAKINEKTNGGLLFSS